MKTKSNWLLSGWTKLKPSEFYHMVMNDDVKEKNISTEIGYNTYMSYYLGHKRWIILYYLDFNKAKNIPEEITKEELTKHFQHILRKDKLEKIRSTIQSMDSSNTIQSMNSQSKI